MALHSSCLSNNNNNKNNNNNNNSSSSGVAVGTSLMDLLAQTSQQQQQQQSHKQQQQQQQQISRQAATALTMSTSQLSPPLSLPAQKAPTTTTTNQAVIARTPSPPAQTTTKTPKCVVSEPIGVLSAKGTPSSSSSSPPPTCSTTAPPSLEDLLRKVGGKASVAPPVVEVEPETVPPPQSLRTTQKELRREIVARHERQRQQQQQHQSVRRRERAAVDDDDDEHYKAGHQRCRPPPSWGRDEREELCRLWGATPAPSAPTAPTRTTYPTPRPFDFDPSMMCLVPDHFYTPTENSTTNCFAPAKTDTCSSSSPSPVIVLDTSVLCECGRMIFDCCPNDRYVVPVMVLHELDGLLKGAKASEPTKARLRDVRTYFLQHAGKRVRMQRRGVEESKRILGDAMNTDDKILACAVYLKEEEGHADVVLATNDRVLAVKALGEGLRAMKCDATLGPMPYQSDQ
eukprot:PhM_4_TR18868/c2_g1_i1/m.104956